MENFFNIITETILSSAIATSIVVFISKKIISNRFERQFAIFKNNLENQTLKTKSEIDKSVLQYQFKINSITTHKSEVLKNLYEKLVDSELAFFELTKPIKFNPPPKEILMKNAELRGNDFITYFYKNEIFLKDDICSYCNEIKDIYLEGYGIQKRRDFFNNDDKEIIHEIAVEMNNFYKERIENRLSILKTTIKMEFQRELGVNL